MAALYLDCSDKLQLGILDASFDWIDFCSLQENRSASIVHELIYDRFNALGLSFKDIHTFIYAAGPGSYTGVRIAEGLAQMLDWGGLRVFSFYHFEVPKLLGFNSGTWITDAFKQEWFVYSWDSENISSQLIQKEHFDQLKENANLFCLNNEIELGPDCKSTQQLIYENSSSFFTKVLSENMRREPFYYRSAEKEFRPSK